MGPLSDWQLSGHIEAKCVTGAYLEHSTHIQDALQLQVHIVSARRHHFDCIVHDKGVGFGARSSNRHRMPAIVVHVDAASVAHRYRSIAHIEHVVDVSVDQLNGEELVPFAAVEEQQTVGLERLEAKVDEDVRVRLEHRQADVRVLGLERGRQVRVSGRRVDEAGSQFKVCRRQRFAKVAHQVDVPAGELAESGRK